MKGDIKKKRAEYISKNNDIIQEFGYGLDHVCGIFSPESRDDGKHVECLNKTYNESA